MRKQINTAPVGSVWGSWERVYWLQAESPRYADMRPHHRTTKRSRRKTRTESEVHRVHGTRAWAAKLECVGRSRWTEQATDHSRPWEHSPHQHRREPWQSISHTTGVTYRAL